MFVAGEKEKIVRNGGVARHGIGLGGLCVSVAAIMWGFDGVVLTPRLFNLDVRYVVFIVHALPFILLNVLFYREYKCIKSMGTSDFIYMFLIALFGGALGTLAIVKALFLVQFKQLTVVALLQKLQPIFAVLLASLLLRERLKREFLLWAVVAIASGYILTFQLTIPHWVDGDAMAVAALYSVFAAFAFGSSTVFGKRILGRISFKAALLFRYGLTAVLMAFIFGTGGDFQGQIAVTTARNWEIFVVIGLTTGSGAIMLYYFGLTKIRASESTFLELCFPVSTVVFDYIFNGDILSPVQGVAALLMMFALYRIGRSEIQPEAVQSSKTDAVGSDFAMSK